MRFKVRSIASIMCIVLSACSTTKPADSDAQNKSVATAKINIQLGMAYLDQHHTQRAKEKFLKALDEAPNSPDAWYAMGYFLEATGDREQAKKYYTKSVDLAPEKGEVQNNYGTFLCRSGQYQEAIQHFQLAIKDITYVESAGAYENAGLCALKIPDKKLALSFLNKSIEQDPDRASVYLELAELYFHDKSYHLAKENLTQFLRVSIPTKESFRLEDQLNEHYKVMG